MGRNHAQDSLGSSLMPNLAILALLSGAALGRTLNSSYLGTLKVSIGSFSMLFYVVIFNFVHKKST